MDKFILAIFEKGKIIYRFGGVITATHQQMEFMIRLLEPSLKKILPKNHYVAYDHASNHNMS